MEKIEKNNLFNEMYVSNKYIYYVKTLPDETLYYIFVCTGILSNAPLIYSTNKCYCFSSPNMPNVKTYLNDKIKSVEIIQNTDLYNITFSEFVNKLKKYVDNYGLKNINQNDIL